MQFWNLHFFLLLKIWWSQPLFNLYITKTCVMNRNCIAKTSCQVVNGIKFADVKSAPMQLLECQNSERDISGSLCTCAQSLSMVLSSKSELHLIKMRVWSDYLSWPFVTKLNLSFKFQFIQLSTIEGVYSSFISQSSRYSLR